MDDEAWLRQALAELQTRDDPPPEEDTEDDTTWSCLTRDPGTGVAVRRARPEDAVVLSNIGARAFRFAHEDGFDSVDLANDLIERFDPDEFAADLARGSAHLLVALWGKTLCGYAALASSSRGQGSEQGSGSAGNLALTLYHRPMELQSLYVAPDWTRQGVGSALLSASVELARSRGHESLWLRLWDGNYRAITFLEHRGFEFAGREMLERGRRRSVNTLVLARALPGMEVR